MHYLGLSHVAECCYTQKHHQVLGWKDEDGWPGLQQLCHHRMAGRLLPRLVVVSCWSVPNVWVCRSRLPPGQATCQPITAAVAPQCQRHHILHGVCGHRLQCRLHHDRVQTLAQILLVTSKPATHLPDICHYRTITEGHLIRRLSSPPRWTAVGVD